jgi:hypothetical protein
MLTSKQNRSGYLPLLLYQVNPLNGIIPLTQLIYVRQQVRQTDEQGKLNNTQILFIDPQGGSGIHRIRVPLKTFILGYSFLSLFITFFSKLHFQLFGQFLFVHGSPFLIV